MLRSVCGDGLLHAPPAIRRALRLMVVGLLLLAAAAPARPSSTQAQAGGPAVEVTKTLVAPAGGIARVGDAVVFQVTLTNGGGTTIDVLPLADTFDPTYLSFVAATIGGTASPPDLKTTNVISWTDLTLLPQVGNLAPGGSVVMETTFTALAETVPGGGLSPTTSSGPPGTPLPGTTALPPNPNDYYDKETRFLIDHAIDPVNGGVYLAVKGDGSLWGPIPDVIYGFPANFFQGSAKHPGGQALCIEYFIREHQRLADTGRTITTVNHGVQRAEDMLTWAKNCANFINAHLIIGKGQNEPAAPPCTVGDGNKCLYYWGFVDASGTSGHMPPTGGVAGFSAPNSHHLLDSFGAWMMAELARTLYTAGDPAYATYKQAAYDFLNWARLVGAPYNPVVATGADPSFSGRDRFWPGLLMALYELSAAEGTPDPTLRADAVNCVNRVGVYNTNIHQRGRCNGTSYTAAYGRAAAHAQEMQNRGVDNYYLPGGRTLWHNFGDNRYGDNPATPNNPTIPFAHGSGRELVAGLQRAHWFYYSFPQDPDPANLVSLISLPGTWTIESWSRQAIRDYWKYSVEKMWDATPGQEAWWDAELRPGREGYKPCFSLGTPVPIGDWKAPLIGDKVHTLNPDGSATVTISGVIDPDWQFVSWRLRGIGVTAVRVFYSIDSGASWTDIPATATATTGTYTATIPPQPSQTVLYYAEAEDAFGNISTFPAGAPQVYQLYTLRNITYNMAWSAGARDVNSTRPPGDGDDTGIEITPRGPTAVTLAQLAATRGADGVTVNWETRSEEQSYGFNIYRGAQPDRSGAVQLNDGLIPARGAGSRYRFRDGAPPDGPLFYWLEEIDFSGRSSWYRVVPSAAPAGSLKVLLPILRR